MTADANVHGIADKFTSANSIEGVMDGQNSSNFCASEGDVFSSSEVMLGDGSQTGDGDHHSGKRNNNETNSELQTDQSARLRRPRRYSNSSSAPSTATSNSDVPVSSLAKRLTQMAVKERENAMYDLHGIPLNDECPQKMQKLLSDLDYMIEERLQFSKSSYADGEDFGEPDLFPLLTKEQQHELMIPPKNGPIATENKPPLDNFTQENSDAQTPAILQRLQFLKHDLDDKEFGEGLRLARQQSPEYVYTQRIKFLRADRYDVNLASARMIRFFDIKRELFCDPGYNGNDRNDRLGCLGRDLRLSDFSEEDLELWKKTGFIQLCGMRDRAKRPILVMFGKVIMEANITSALLLRAYLYVCNLWSRDESTQRAGAVVIAYNMFTDPSVSKKRSSRSTPSTMDGSVQESSDYSSANDVDEAVEQYMKQTHPFSSQIIRVAMSAQLRSVSIHFCIDHHILNSQYEKIAGYMSTATVARLRCHYASANNPETSIFGASDIGETNDTDNIPNHDHSDKVGKNDHRVLPESSSQQQNHKNDLKKSTVNPHSEVLYKLMTFGIPRETIPISDATGEIQVELHQAILEAIGEQEDLDRNQVNGTKSIGSHNKNMVGITSSTASDKLWMSLTASTGSSASFALFPNLLDDEELEEGSDHSSSSLFGHLPSGDLMTQTKVGSPLPDLSSSLSEPVSSSPIDNGQWARKPAAFDPSSANEVANQIGTQPLNSSVPELTPTPNDIIMGRGPWNRNHPGNLLLKAMLERERDRYESVNRFERMRIVDGMLNELYHERGARFLYKRKPKDVKTDEMAGDDVWLEAKREKAHDKITHDFRNLRRQKHVSPK